jgi:hypothetical protein
MGLSDEKPFFADKTIVGDYKPLINYWKKLREIGESIDDALLKPQDFKHIREIIKTRNRISLDELLGILTEYFIKRVKCDVASEVLRELYGVDFDREYACRKIASILAGWLIEASKNTGLLKISYPWKTRK